MISFGYRGKHVINVHICRNFGFNICLGCYAHLNLDFWQMFITLLKQFVSAKPEKPVRKVLLKLYIWWNHTVYMCIFPEKNVFLREQIELWPENSISCNLCETDLAWMTEKLFSLIYFWQWTSKCHIIVTIINQLCAFDYYLYAIMILCPSVHHWCMALPFVMCSIVGAWVM